MDAIAARTAAELFAGGRHRLAPAVWDYLAGGAESEAALLRNRSALDALAFVPRVLRDVSRADPAAQFLGRAIDLPVFLAPIGSLRLFDEAAALASAAAAADAKVPFFMSIMAQPTLEEVAAAVPGCALVLQIYMRGDRAWLGETVARAEAAGCAALCLTVDAPVYGRRERDLENRFSSAAAVDRVNFGDRPSVQITPEQASLTWDTIAWLRGRTRLPLIIKGILDPADARLCAEHGVDVVYLSNHGGRQLDHADCALNQIAAAAEAVAGRCRIYVDGGFVRGTDILKARALGADLVGLGKAQGAALAAGGRAGLVRLLAILRDEVLTTLALLGCASLAELTASCLRSVAPVAAPHPFGLRPSHPWERPHAPTDVGPRGSRPS
ncbi:MAG: glycolate oxidase [Enterovirga sp.]|nr:glycolate oxidase [Enterovirga sp.]